MSEEKRIWLLSCGDYSNYNVKALFDDEHKGEGEEIAALIGGEIEEEPFLLNSFDFEKPPPGKVYRCVLMYRDGSVDEIDERCTLLDEDGKRFRQYYWLDSKETYPNVPKSRWRLCVRMYCKRKEHIVKVAGEIRIQILAGVKPTRGDIP